MHIADSFCLVNDCFPFFHRQDDSSLNRKIVRKILESADFPECAIHEADDGSSAIEEVKNKRERGVEFDFILIDFVMVS